jgi:hypothetical protein
MNKKLALDWEKTDPSGSRMKPSGGWVAFFALSDSKGGGLGGYSKVTTRMLLLPQVLLYAIRRARGWGRKTPSFDDSSWKAYQSE